MAKKTAKKYADDLKPTIRVSIRALMARINRIEGYKVMKYYTRAAEPEEQYFVLRTRGGGEEIFRRADFVLQARVLKALAPYEFMGL